LITILQRAGRFSWMPAVVMMGLAASGTLCRAGSILKVGNPGEGIFVGDLLVRPSLRVKGSYDDNIFWTDKDAEEDYFLTISPAILLEYLNNEYLARFSYGADILYFLRNASQNHCNHRLTGLLSYSFSDYTIKVNDLFRRTSERFETEERNWVRRIENTGQVMLSRNFLDLDLDLSYKNFYRDYLQDGYRQYNHQQHSGIAVLFYQMAPRTKALLEYTYNRILYLTAEERNGYYNEVRGGLKGKLTDKLTALAKVGYQNRQYEEKDLEDFSGLVGLVSLEEYFSARTNLRLSWERTLRESTYSANNFYLINRAQASLGQQLLEKIRGYLDLIYLNHRYRVSPPGEPKRRDDIWMARAGVRYQIQPWLYLNASYTYSNRDSNLAGMDYQDNLASLELVSYY